MKEESGRALRPLKVHLDIPGGHGFGGTLLNPVHVGTCERIRGPGGGRGRI